MVSGNHLGNPSPGKANSPSPSTCRFSVALHSEVDSGEISPSTSAVMFRCRNCVAINDAIEFCIFHVVHICSALLSSVLTRSFSNEGNELALSVLIKISIRL